MPMRPHREVHAVLEAATLAVGHTAVSVQHEALVARAPDLVWLCTELGVAGRGVRTRRGAPAHHVLQVRVRRALRHWRVGNRFIDRSLL
jgi:hypothetical protein